MQGVAEKDPRNHGRSVKPLMNVALIGDTGIVGREIQNVLSHHDGAEVAFRKNSKRSEGRLDDCEFVFLATRDEESMALAPEMVSAGKRVVDTSGAFRLPKTQFEQWYQLEHQAPELLKEAVYGMPALFGDRISEARLVGNPGCYPTSVILPLHPLKTLIKGEATIVATSGISGARREVEDEPNELTYNYGRRHKHVPEIVCYSGFEVNFTPIVLHSVFRGINANIRIELEDRIKSLSDEEAARALEEAISNTYVPEDLVKVVQDSDEKRWGTKEVVDTHRLLVKVRVDDGFAYICSMEDNLGKGAASQAVENMNLMLGLPRLSGIEAAYGETLQH